MKKNTALLLSAGILSAIGTAEIAKPAHAQAAYFCVDFSNCITPSWQQAMEFEHQMKVRVNRSRQQFNQRRNLPIPSCDQIPSQSHCRWQQWRRPQFYNQRMILAEPSASPISPPEYINN